jgi:hypothetical protein
MVDDCSQQIQSNVLRVPVVEILSQNGLGQGRRNLSRILCGWPMLLPSAGARVSHRESEAGKSIYALRRGGRILGTASLIYLRKGAQFVRVEIEFVRAAGTSENLPKLQDEFVQLHNRSKGPVRVASWTLIDMSPEAIHLHSFRFPTELEGNREWTVGPSERIRVYTASSIRGGPQKFNAQPSILTFCWGLDHPVWMDPRHYVALRDQEGVVIDHRAVGDILLEP